MNQAARDLKAQHVSPPRPVGAGLRRSRFLFSILVSVVIPTQAWPRLPRRRGISVRLQAKAPALATSQSVENPGSAAALPPLFPTPLQHPNDPARSAATKPSEVPSAFRRHPFPLFDPSFAAASVLVVIPTEGPLLPRRGISSRLPKAPSLTTGSRRGELSCL